MATTVSPLPTRAWFCFLFCVFVVLYETIRSSSVRQEQLLLVKEPENLSVF